MLPEHVPKPRKAPRHISTSREPEPSFSFVIRAANAGDLPDIREIYNYYVTNSVVTFDEEIMSLRAWRAKFEYLDKLRMPFLVAASPSGQILGYALVSPWKQKRAYRFTVENSIYLRPAASGKGLGRKLLVELLNSSKEVGLKEIIAVIADRGAEASLKIHGDLGFKEIGRMGRVGFKFQRWVGTVILQKSLK